jgi:hypothetical protein
MSAFETARDIRMPGVVLDRVYIDPSLLTPRMKNAVKKMLREGYAKGGWSSKARQLAVKIAAARDLHVVDSNLWGFCVPPFNTYGPKQVKEALELIDAAQLIELMEDASRFTEPSYVTTQQNRTRSRYDNYKFIVTHNCDRRWIGRCSNKELTQQIADVFISCRTPALIERAEKVCDMLDNNEHIQIRISY